MDPIARAGTDDLSELAKYGAPLKFDAESVAAGLVEIIDRVTQRRRLFEGEAAEVRSNPLLSEIGKRDRLVSLAQSALRDVEMISDGNAAGNLRDTLAAIRRQAAKLEAKLAERPAGDSAASAVRAVFLWERLEKIDVLVRPEHFFKAIELGDAVTYEAFVDAPAILELLPPDILAQGVEIWNSQRDPKTARDISDLRAVADRLEKTAREARQRIAELGGLEEADPLKQLATGKRSAP